MVNRRRRHNATEMLEHRRTQRRSGLTIEAYCKERVENKFTFYGLIV